MEVYSISLPDYTDPHAVWVDLNPTASLCLGCLIDTWREGACEQRHLQIPLALSASVPPEPKLRSHGQVQPYPERERGSFFFCHGCGATNRAACRCQIEADEIDSYTLYADNPTRGEP